MLDPPIVLFVRNMVERHDGTPAGKIISVLTDPTLGSVTQEMDWDVILLYMAAFGRVLEGDQLEAFTKKWNPERKAVIKYETAIKCLLDFIKDPELLLALEAEAKVLDQKTHDVVHHAEEFRFMMQQLGVELPENYIQHLIKEALALHRSDDEFNICSLMEFLCATQPLEDPSKKQGK